MDYNTLLSRVQGGLDSETLVFSLNQTELESNQIETLASTYLPDNTFSLTQASISQPTSDTILVSGTGVDLPFTDLAVELTFYMSDTEAACKIQGMGASDWVITDSFPPMALSIGPDLVFDTAKIYLYSEDVTGEYDQGMTFDGDLGLASMTGGLTNLLGWTSQPVSGKVDLQDNGDTFNSIALSTTAATNIDLYIATVPSLDFTIGTELLLSTVDDEDYVSPYIGLSADLTFSTNDNGDFVIPVSVELAQLNGEAYFSADISSGISAVFDDIAGLVNDFDLEGLLSNDQGYSLTDSLKLVDLQFVLDMDAQELSRVLLEVQSKEGEQWTIFTIADTNSSYSLSDIYAKFIVFNPNADGSSGTTASGSALITGDLTLGNAGTLTVAYQIEENTFTASLKEDTTMYLDSLLTDMLGNSAGVPTIEVDIFLLEISGSDYSIDLEVESNWVIDAAGIALNQLDLSLVHDSTSATTTTTMSANIGISAVTLYLEADYPGSDASGWTFKGSTESGQEISIGDLFDDIAETFGDFTLPDVLSDLTISNIEVEFNTGTNDFFFTCTTTFPIDDQDVDMVLTIDCKHDGSSYTNTLSGTVTLGDLNFGLEFVDSDTADIFLATFSSDEGESVKIADLAASVSSTVAGYIPSSLSLTLEDAWFCYYKTKAAEGETTTGRFIFGLDLGTGFNLSNLPLVGSTFTGDRTISVDDLQLVLALEAFTQAEVGAINGFLGGLDSNITQLQDQDLMAGLSAAASMEFGTDSEVLDLSIANDGTTDSSSSESTTVPKTSSSSSDSDSDSDSALWYTLQKTFGPVHFERVGVQYKNEELWFYMDASMSTSGLTIDLEGLGFGSPLSKFDPDFTLSGLGIEYDNGTVAIGGEFLRTTVNGNDEYEGDAVLKTTDYTLSAIGSYTKVDGQPSMFIYAYLDAPLGGPAFFNVEGLAAGFGYNNALTTPSVDEVESFPLVDEAINGTGNISDLTAEITKMEDYLTPSVGDDFLALGIKFNSFKLIDSFALFLFEIGDNVQIKILGVSEVVVPTPVEGESVTPLARIKMELEGYIDPEDGEMGFEAQITDDSYIIDKDCQLTGGYAFYAWTTGEHAGDFVMTMGGYHPDFEVPDHYPTVPRLSLDWKIDSNTSISGTMYYALTGHALMAGGSLSASWKSGNLKAWFDATADFLIAWKPYHYSASLSVDIGASYKFKVNLGFTKIHKTVTFDVSADVDIWGPEFGGKAKVKVSIVSFTIKFGSSNSSSTEAINWDTYSASFLPETEDQCSLTATSGLSGTTEESGEEIWIVDPNTFSISTGSVIPSKQAYLNHADDPDGTAAETEIDLSSESLNTDLGIGSMDVLAADFSSQQVIGVWRQSSAGGWENVNDELIFTPQSKSVPAALWGQNLSPSVNDDSLIGNTLSGFLITPPSPTAGNTHAVKTADLAMNTDRHADYFDLDNTYSIEINEVEEDTRRTDITTALNTSEVQTTRAEMLTLLGFSSTVSLSDDIVSEFMIAPQLIKET